MADFIAIELRCHCGKVQASAEVLASALPMSMILCHCSSCNSVSGQLCSTRTALPLESRFTHNGKAKGYERSSHVKRFFCDTCGTTVFEDTSGSAPGGIVLATGAITTSEVDYSGRMVPLVVPAHHLFVADTKDGGLRDWTPDDPAWEGWNDKSISIPIGRLWGPPQGTKASGKTHCRCHCGGVEFHITPPDSGRYRAGLCACASCRQTTGTEITAWALVPKEAVEEVNKSTWMEYQSSPGLLRCFCSVCGSSTININDMLSSELVIAVGMMNGKDATTGHRNQHILKWKTDEIMFADLAQNASLIQSLEKGLKVWSVAEAATKRVG